MAKDLGRSRDRRRRVCPRLRSHQQREGHIQRRWSTRGGIRRARSCRAQLILPILVRSTEVSRFQEISRLVPNIFSGVASYFFSSNVKRLVASWLTILT